MRCEAEYTFPAGHRPRVVRCILADGHADSQHFATWGGSQQWRQVSWNDEGAIENSRVTSAVDVLREFVATLPRGHHEKPGVLRAIEVLRDAEGGRTAS